MGQIFVDGIGTVEIAGDIPTPEEAAAIAGGIPTDAEPSFKQEPAPEGYRKTSKGFTLPGPVQGPDATAVGMMAPAGIVANAAVGGVLAATEPTEQGPDFWVNKAKQFLTGAVVGGGLAAVGKGVGKLLAPANPAEVNMLREGGVKLTAAQTRGGAVARAEQGAESVPFAGDIISSARKDVVDSFNLATIDRALAVVGQKLDEGTAAGHKAVEQLGEKTSAIYQSLLPKLGIRADQPFDQSITEAVTNNLTTVSRETGETFSRLVNKGVMDRFDASGNMTGEEMKKVESFLTQKIKDIRATKDVDRNDLANALTDVRTGLRNLVMRSNPDDAPMLGRINTAYAMQLRIEKAAAKADEGKFSAAQLASAVKAKSSATTREAAQGDALLQDWAEAAKKVIGSKEPNSGTPYRAMLALAARKPHMLAAAPAAAALYNPMTQSMLGSAIRNSTGLSRIPGAAAAPSAVGLGQSMWGQ